MLDLSHITYIGINGKKDNKKGIDLMNLASKKISETIKFANIVILSACEPSQKYSGVNIVSINPMTYNEYKLLEFKYLINWTKTDYLLSFHDDGFAVNAKNWENNFNNYDYIGAPWTYDSGWSFPGREIGNGGFSLRTRKLYEKTKNLEIPNNMSSDGAICCYYRDYLIDLGIKFADLNTGYKFSVEGPFDEDHDLEKTFGFHASRHLEKAKKILEIEQ